MTKRYWWSATPSEIYARMAALEAELSVAASLLELREEWCEADGGRRSPVITDLQAKWKVLLEADAPEPQRDAA